MIFANAEANINIKNGRIVYRNSGRSGTYYGAIAVGISSPPVITNGVVANAVVNLKDVEFYTLHWSGSTGTDTKIAPVFCSTLWKSEFNLYNSVAISEDAQAVKFVKASKTPTDADKTAMLEQGLGYKVTMDATSKLGSLADFAAVTLSDLGKTDAGVPFNLDIIVPEAAYVFGTDLFSGGIVSELTENLVTDKGTLLNFGPASCELTLPDGSTIASSSTVGAKPSDLPAAAKAALIYTPLAENQTIASYVSTTGSESSPMSLTAAFGAWKSAHYKGGIKLHAKPAKDDVTALTRAFGGSVSFATTTTTKSTQKAAVLVTGAASEGNLTLDLNGLTVSTSNIFLATDPALNGFTLEIKNGKLESTAAAAVLLDGSKVGVTMENVEISIPSGDGYCVYDYRVDHSYLFLRGCKMTADKGGAIYVLTNDTNKSDSSLLYYVLDSDLEYTNTATAGRPIMQGTNVSNKANRSQTMIFDGNTTLVTTFSASSVPYAAGTAAMQKWCCFLGGSAVRPATSTPAPWTITMNAAETLLTTEELAAATLTAGEMTFHFKSAAEAVRYAALFGRCFENVTATMKQDVHFATMENVENTGFVTAFTLDFDGHAFTGGGTQALLKMTGSTDITIRNASISNGTASVMSGTASYTYENCSINSDYVFGRISNKVSATDTAMYTMVTTGEVLYFSAAADAIVYSQSDPNATAELGGKVKLLADDTAKATFAYNADESCLLRLNENAKALDIDLNGFAFRIPGTLAVGSDAAFAKTLNVTIANGTWEQTAMGAAAFLIEGSGVKFHLEFRNVNLISAGNGISYFAADSGDNAIVITGSTIVSRRNGIETLNGAMSGRIGGSITVTDSVIAAVNKEVGYAIVDGVATAEETSHILLVGGDIALYSAVSTSVPVKLSEQEGDFCAAPQYKAVLKEERSQAFSGEKIKEATGVAETLAGKAYEALTRWTPNTIAYYETKDMKLTSFATAEELIAAYLADEAGDGTMTIITNVTFPETISIEKNVTIQLSGKILSVTDADAIHVAAGKTLTVQNGYVKSGATAIVNEGTLNASEVTLVGANALQTAGDAASTAQLEDSALYALDANGCALQASGANGSSVTLNNTVVAAPYAVSAVTVADGNTVEFLTVPEIYAKSDRDATGFEVAENGTMIVPNDLVVTMLLQKTKLVYPEGSGTEYTVSSFGFATVEVTFKSENTVLYKETIYAGLASDYAEIPSKISYNNSTYIFAGWVIDGGDETVYKVGALPKVFENTVFIATFEETRNIATITLNDAVTYYDDLSKALAAVTDGAELKIWRDLTLEQPLDVNKGNFTFNLGGFTITALDLSYAVGLKADNVTLKNGKIVSNAETVKNNSHSGTNLVDLQLQSAAAALSVDGGNVQISTSRLVGFNEAIVVSNGSVVSAYSSEFYSTNDYALTVDGAATKLTLSGSNKVGSVPNGQLLLQVKNGAELETVNDTFYMTKALLESGTWYECDDNATFVVQSVFPERNASYIAVSNAATGYSQTAEFYAVTSESAAATINGVSYSSLYAAINAANSMNEATIVLLRDIEASNEYSSSYSLKKNMTIDLNGHVLIGRLYAGLFSMSSGVEITVKNGTIIAPSKGKSASGSSNVYNMQLGTNATYNFENVNYFAYSHNFYTATSTTGFTLNFSGGMIVSYGTGYAVYINYSYSSFCGTVTMSNGAIMIGSSNKMPIYTREGKQYCINIQDAYTYGAADGNHFRVPPEETMIPDEEDAIQILIPEAVTLDTAANPRQFLQERFGDLTVKYAQHLPSFTNVSTSSLLLHHINDDGVAEYEGVTYGSVADALAMAAGSEDPVVVKLLKDTTESGISTVAANVTLDLNGKTLSFTGSADMTVAGKVELNGGKMQSEGNVHFLAGSTDITGTVVTDNYRLDQRLRPTAVSLTLNDGVAVNFKVKVGALDSFNKIFINGETAERMDSRTYSAYSRTFDFDAFTTTVEMTAIDSNGIVYSSGYKTGVKTFADAVAQNGSGAMLFRTAMSTLSQFGDELAATHDWTKAKDLENTAFAAYVDPNKAFDLKLTGGTAGAKVTFSYTDSTSNEARSEELTFSAAGEAVFKGLYTACLSDTVTVSCGGVSDTFTYADLVKTAYGETALYNSMIAYSNAANALFKG